MNIKNVFRKILNRGPVSVVLSVVLAVLFVTGLVNAATTISTSIVTGGSVAASTTLQVTGVTTLYDNLQVGKKASTDGNGVVVTAGETESTGEGLGVYTEVPSTGDAVVGTETYRVLKSTWSRLWVNKAQTADVSLFGAENQLKTAVGLGNGQHFGSWSVFEAPENVTLASPGLNGGASISIFGESAKTLTVASGATLSGLMIDNSAKVANSGTFDAIHIKYTSTGAGSTATKWTTGITITGVTTDLKLQNDETIDNGTDGVIDINATTTAYGFATTTSQGVMMPTSRTAAPVTCGADYAGGLIWNSTKKVLCVCDATTWEEATSTVGTNCF